MAGAWLVSGTAFGVCAGGAGSRAAAEGVRVGSAGAGAGEMGGVGAYG